MAAKLITIFIEHPVVFLGYSISDSNIQEILQSIVACLDNANIQKLQDNLIFVEWIAEEDYAITIERQDIMMANKVNLPVIKIKTHSFKEVYELLQYYERSIPANVLREYKSNSLKLFSLKNLKSRYMFYHLLKLIRIRLFRLFMASEQ